MRMDKERYYNLEEFPTVECVKLNLTGREKPIKNDTTRYSTEKRAML